MNENNVFKNYSNLDTYDLLLLFIFKCFNIKSYDEIKETITFGVKQGTLTENQAENLFEKCKNLNIFNEVQDDENN